MRFHFSASSQLILLSLVVAIGCSGGTGAQLTVPDSPGGTVEVVLDGLVDHHPEIVWRGLPPSYQQDVADLARDFADTVDPVVFDRAVAVTRKSVVVLQSKKEIILGAEAFKRMPLDAETVDAVWEAAVHMLDALLASDIVGLSTLRELDVDAFLATTGSVLMDQASQLPAGNEEMMTFVQQVEAYRDVEVEVVGEDGDRAVVMLAIPDEEPMELELVRIEDRWIPAELAAHWPQAVAEVGSRIEFLASDEAAQIKVRALFGLGVVEGFVDQINQMESSEEIDDLIGGLLGNFMPSQGGPAVTDG